MWNKRLTVNPGETLEAALRREQAQVPVYSPILDGRPVKDLELTGNVGGGLGIDNWTVVYHGLGRVPVGCLQSSTTADSAILPYLKDPTEEFVDKLPTSVRLWIWCEDVRNDRVCDLWVW